MAKRKSSLINAASLNQSDVSIQAIAPLGSILPDPGQPRRLLPDDLLSAVIQGSLAPVAAIEEWLRRAESDTAETALRQNVRELKRLADSIARHGLISPISVRFPASDEAIPPGITYFIVTGERRFWAHVYLLSQDRQIQAGQTVASPAEIKITLAPPGISIRAYQLIENLLREDLNAIERAQGMWALRYELSGVNYSSPPSNQPETEEDSSLPSPESEVNYSSPQLVPWARVEEALGISKRYRIFVTSVLNLSEAAQALVAGHNLAEMTIRPITQKLKNKPDLQVKALEQLIEWQNSEEEESPGQPIVTSIKEFVDKLLIDELIQSEGQTTEATPTKRVRSVSSAPVIRFRDKVRETLDFLNRLKKTDRVELARALQRGDYADVMIDLRILREQIDAILSTVSESADVTMIPPTMDQAASTGEDLPA